MKKPGAHFKFNDTQSLSIILLGIVVLFILFIKPIYLFIGDVKSGAFFDRFKKTDVEAENKSLENKYVILTPEGATRVNCKKTVSSAGGDKTIDLTLYHTLGKLQSISVKYKYSGMTDDYSNYIFLAQNQFKEKKTYNLKNKGYSVEYDISGTKLTASEVYLLNKTTIEKTGSFSETKDIVGELDQDINKVITIYLGEDYKCDGGAQ